MSSSIRHSGSHDSQNTKFLAQALARHRSSEKLNHPFPGSVLAEKILTCHLIERERAPLEWKCIECHTAYICLFYLVDENLMLSSLDSNNVHICSKNSTSAEM